MDAIEVFVRVRPIISQDTNISITNNNKSITIESRRCIQCQYDRVFGPDTSQKDIFVHVKSCVEQALSGYNSTILAYGQTGSGKSHTMFGSNGKINRDPGIVPRSIRHIFQGLRATGKDWSVSVSFMQVYNDQIYDLYDKPMRSLHIQEKGGSILVPDLMQYRVTGLEQCLALIDLGLKSRAIRETSMNHVSSRSHLILQMFIEQIGADECKRTCSKINLVDLAGSERWGNSSISLCEQQIHELTNINSSLHTLGRVISALAKVCRDTQNPRLSRKVIHIPYRDSKLTRILQDSLGGNAKTCLIATINPLLVFEDESINTLRFADRAHQVMTHAKVNEIQVTNYKEMHNLQSEIRRLKLLLQQHGIDDSQATKTPQYSDHMNDPRKLNPSHNLGYKCNKEDKLMVASEDQVKKYHKHQHHQMNFLQSNWHSYLDRRDITSKVQNHDTGEKIIEVISSVTRLVEELLKSNSVLPKTIVTDNNDQTYRINSIGSTQAFRTKDSSKDQTTDVVPRNMLTSLLAQRKKIKSVTKNDET
mmetsp:Transcript_4253/g.8141  ORF Transcript_4253/g.8141 Transcript_4253/m.8141 type:complete len:534 (+) Transcript_4253:1685-3286(+)